MGKTFVGFGFGAIQGGLFLPEAYRSGNFSRLVVSEIDSATVEQIWKSKEIMPVMWPNRIMFGWWKLPVLKFLIL